ncbi:non-ribosomal peptide synthetase [Micromonospora lutea]|uniref:Phenyloxazoline synthase MbtB n=1 Tax=Micromonospora lutea TaxID=419825 RepID=A0ABQ4IT07_9ACTN|nr:non-ribosomal peptide synthetase [Micromonospora lutea]GIJ21061.1 hypothetical protein Vlu01_16850 [Micromonospora lutea]
MPDPSLGALDTDLVAAVEALSAEQQARFEEILQRKLRQDHAIRRRPATGPGPASFGQERMWVTAGAAVAANNYASAIRLRGALSLAALRDSLARLVARHEALRTVFRLEDGQLVTEVVAASRVPLLLVDLSTLDLPAGPDLPPLLRTLVRTESARPFDLGRGPALRVHVFRLGPHDHWVLLTVHHAATDGWSNGVLIRELSECYRALTAGRPWAPPALPIRYVDYAAWQRDRLAGPEGMSLTAFWQRYLHDLPQLDLPFDAPVRGPNSAPGLGSNHSLLLDRGLTARLTELHSAAGDSRFTLVLAAVVAVVSAVTVGDDVVVGTLTAGRTRPELRDLVGYFVNVVPIRFRPRVAASFRQLMAHVREHAGQALAHQEMPYERLLDLLRADSLAAGGSPIQVLCVAHPTIPHITMPGIDVELHDVDLTHAPFPLVIEARDRSDGLEIALQYDSARLTGESVVLLGHYLRTVLTRVAEDPDATCADLLAEQAAPVARPQTGPDNAGVHRLVEEVAATRPDAVAIRDGERQLSYGALNRRANQVARGLRALGVRPDDRVVVCLPRSADAVVAQLAVVKSGAAYVPLDPAHPRERLAAILADARPRVLVTTTGHDPQLSDAPQSLLLDRDAAVISAQPVVDLRLAAHPDQGLYLIYTSGSTGEPKGVVGTHRGLVNRIRWMAQAYPVAAGEVCAVRTSPTFVDAVWETFGPLCAGGVLAIVGDDEVLDPWALMAFLRRQQVARVVVVPALLGMLLDAESEWDKGASLPHTWITSGEQLPTAVALRFLRQAPAARLVNLYGSAEAAADAVAAEVTAPVPVRVPIGVAIGGVTAWIGDATTRPCAPLVPGEIFVGGSGLARGYHGRPGPTALAFLPDPTGGGRVYRTGDLGRLRADGRLEYLGRRDGQLQIRGHRVEPGEVEAVLLSHTGVRHAGVTGVESADGSMHLAGHVVPRAGVDPRVLMAELRGLLRVRLPRYLVPSTLAVRDSLPRTSSGKLDRRALAMAGPVEPAAPVETPAVQVDPVDERERLVAEAFAEVLGVARVDRDDDFFFTGGHSILGAELVRVLGERLGVRVALADLFEAPTVASLAARLTRASRQTDDPDALRPDPTRWYEPFPLTDVQAAYYVGRDPQVTLGGVATHAYLELALDQLDVDRFARALRAVVRRHPMLRAVMEPDGTQRVLADVPEYEIVCHDLRGHDVDRAAARLAKIRAEMSHQVLPADRWPLFEVRASLLADSSVVHVSLDALICDAYSFGLIMDELAARYRDPGLVLPELGLTFRDYVVHQIARRDGRRHGEALAYWRRRLPDLPAGPELPLASATAASGPPRFTRLDGKLTAADWARLKQRATVAGLTPSGLLLAAFAEIVSAWSARPHYTLMLTVFNREPLHPEVGRIVGDFTALSVLEIDHTGHSSFADRARVVQRRLWDDLDHAQVSAVSVMREWAERRGLPPTPITPIVFTSNLSVGGPDDGVADGRGNLGELTYGITQTPQVHLDHQVSERHGELLFNWDIVDGIFSDGVPEAMFDAYRDLLARLADDATDWSEPVRPPVPPAQACRRAATADTSVPVPDHCLHEAVGAAARANPDRIAVIDGAVRLTYAVLMERSGRVARALRGHGAGRGRLVGITARRGWQQVVAALGVLRAGAAFLPLDPQLPPQRLALLAERGELELLLTQADLVDALPALPGVRTLAVEDLPAVPVGGEQDVTSHPDDLAYVIFTSGSTGEPKGVAISHRGAANTIACVNRRFDVGVDDRVLAVSSLSFDLAIYDIFGMLAAGAATVLVDAARQRDPGHWARLISEHGITLWNSVPALAELLVEYSQARDPDALGSLRVVMLSGDWIPVSLPDRVRALTGAEVMSLGGATEASIWSVWYPIGSVGPDWRSVPYGTPLANQTLCVLDADLYDRPDWVSGDLYIGGAGLALGYWRAEELTRASFPTHPRTGERLYRTGDLARYLPDGNLEFLGRRDSQVKINGFRVEIGEIEATAARLPSVRLVAVVAVGAAAGGRRLAGFVVPTDPATFDLDGFCAALARTLPDYMLPSTWSVRDGLPLTGNGKVDHAALRDLPVTAEPVTAPSDVSSSPATVELVTALAEVWRDALAVDEVDPHTSFFALGGNSLVAIRMLGRIQETFGVQLSLPDLFASPTVATLAAMVADARVEVASAADARVVVRPDPVARYEPFPLTDIQQAYWVGRRASQTLGGIATHSYVELDVRDLEVDRLEAALRALIDRHDALRTVVRPDGSAQVLRDVPPYRIERDDVTGMPPAQARALLDGLREELSHEVRDTAAWPMFAVRAVRVGDRTTRLYLSFDLLHVDARSMRIVTDELMTLYRDPEAALTPIGLTFRDYVLAVGRLRESTEYVRAREYWRERLTRLPAPPALPLVSRLEEISTTSFTRLRTTLDVSAWRAVREWAAAAQVTPSSLLCAAFCDTLARWSAQPRFTLNVTTFGRRPLHPDVDALVGDFTVTTLLDVDCATGSLARTARGVQEQIWRDLQHDLVGGVEVARMLRRHPTAPAAQPVPVVFTSTLGGEDAQGDGATVGAAEPWQAAPVFSVSQTPQVLLDHQVGMSGDELVCTWDYVAEAFPPGLVESMFAAYRAVVDALATHAFDEPGGARR